MDIFTPITNAECVLPPKNASTGGKRRTYRGHRGGKRKTPRFILNIHSPKHTRHGRKNRRNTRRRK
jgi:hypothetical protein